MNENKTMMINDTAVVVKEYKGKRVVTLKEIDQCHGRPDGTASRNFRKNREHFVEGEDYFKISSDEFRRTIGSMDKRQQNEVALITKSGYLMLVKSLKFNINVNFLLFLSIFSYNSYIKKQIYIVYDFFVREKSNSLRRGSLAIRSITSILQKGMVLLDDFEQHRFSVNRAILHILLWLLCS